MRSRLSFFIMAALLVALGIGGCGGEGKSSDPLGTDSLAFGNSADSAVLTLDPDEAVQLTAKVKDAAGKPVADREVFFEITPNASGATLSSLKVTTNTAGEAAILYRAGAGSGVDVVHAFISNGSRRDVFITVKSGPVQGTQISLSAAPTSLAAGQNSILTAMVTDSTGAPLKDQAVTFTFLPGGNRSGAALITLSGMTDVSGKAVAVYTAGANNPTESVQDTIQATVAGSLSVGAVIVTRTAGGGGGMNVSVAASGTSLAAGQTAIITATVTDGTSAPISGQAVTFAFAAGSNKSGATLTILSGTTDVSGRAIAQYTAGANSPTVAVQDTILASVPGSTAAIVITRTIGVVAGFQITVSATPTSLSAGAISIVMAQLMNADGTAAAGRPVSFAFISNASGATLSPLNSGITDASGKALAIYTAGSSSPTLAVQDVITASVPGAVAAAIITRQAAAPVAGNRISSITAVPATLSASAVGGTSIITVTVIKGDNITPAPGEAVTFSVLGVGSSAPVNAVTGNDGRAISIFTYTGGAISGTQSVVLAQISGGSAAVIINWGP